MNAIIQIGAGIRFHRRKAGLTQAKLARLASVGKASVFDVEKGKESIQMDTLMKILSVLNIKLEMKSSLMDEFLQTTAHPLPENKEPS